MLSNVKALGNWRIRQFASLATLIYSNILNDPRYRPPKNESRRCFPSQVRAISVCWMIPTNIRIYTLYLEERNPPITSQSFLSKPQKLPTEMVKPIITYHCKHSFFPLLKNRADPQGKLFAQCYTAIMISYALVFRECLPLHSRSA